MSVRYSGTAESLPTWTHTRTWHCLSLSWSGMAALYDMIPSMVIGKSYRLFSMRAHTCLYVHTHSPSHKMTFIFTKRRRFIPFQSMDAIAQAQTHGWHMYTRMSSISMSDFVVQKDNATWALNGHWTLKTTFTQHALHNFTSAHLTPQYIQCGEYCALRL